MDYLKHLNTVLSAGGDSKFPGLKSILMSGKTQAGAPHDEAIAFLLSTYQRRMISLAGSEDQPLGLVELVENLSSISNSERATVLPLKDDSLSGECVIVNNELVGCAFVKRGVLYLNRGLWIDGKRIE
ncbi:hypothetical protein [Pseudomonas sp. KNUC1026]|uniref:hypothetical protein n=1 Tax=Pseudomonas sp. KNUC1026 TaxID=2893890 RepID=UPI001F260B33|nr:hypothetical protein [Pseudomonas sp. KNUC1026]UFH49885.1 hypothetical protein LN139_00320 [Pseudomonas sp. KNUC1026]